VSNDLCRLFVRLAKHSLFGNIRPRLRGILAKRSIPYSFYGIAQIRIRPDPKRGVSGVPTRILIADDHKSAIREIRTLLGANPEWEVCGEAANGQEALARANEMHPDVIVMDFAMPVMNGLEVLRQIVRRRPKIKVLAFSVHDSKQIVEEILAAGAHSYLSKATAGQNLVHEVRELLNVRVHAEHA